MRSGPTASSISPASPPPSGEHIDLGGGLRLHARVSRSASSPASAPGTTRIQIACWKAAPALACGNAMIFKPAELTPLTALRSSRRS